MADVLPFQPNRPRRPARPAPLWREVLGRSLRTAREDRGERLVDTAERAGISPQYLSEIERGRKEPSSEMIAAVAGALGLTLPDLLTTIAADVTPARTPARLSPHRLSGPTLLAA
jgi:transcriptional regulator with XRE-family HTH domain